MKKEKTMHELCKEFPDQSYRELEKYRDADRHEEASKIPLTESQQKQEDLEPIGMGHNHPPKGEGVCVTGALRKSRDPVLSRVKELEVALANALAVNESHQKLNGKLQERLTEVEEENKKMHDHLDKQVQSARKAGM
jgi:hypothetical protein